MVLVEKNGVRVENGYDFQIDPGGRVTRHIDLYDKFRVFRGPRGTGSGTDIDLSLNSSEAFLSRTITVDTLTPVQGEYKLYTQERFADSDVRSNPTHAAASIVSAYYGYDVRKYDALDFGAAQRALVFESLSEDNTSWDTVQTALPVGCGHQSKDSGEIRTTSETEHFSKESYQESWGFNLGGTVPLPNPAISVSAKLGIDHSESENKSKREVYISNHYRRDAYIGWCDPYDDTELRKYGGAYPYLDPIFTNDIINLDPHSPSDADQFIDTYGTHYPGAVLYGGFSTYLLTLSEDNYEKSKSLNVDFSAAINNAGSAGNTKEKNLTQTHSNVQYSTKTFETEGKKPPSSGEVGFSYGRDESFEKVLNESTSKWISIGTEPDRSFADVYATNESAVPLEMDWKRLDRLIHVDLVDSRLSSAELSARRNAISAAIDRAIDEAKSNAQQTPTKPEKGYKFRITGVDVDVIRDETDPGLTGKIEVCSNGLPSCVTVWDTCDHPDKHIGAIRKQCWVPHYNKVENWTTDWKELVTVGTTTIGSDGTPSVSYNEPHFSTINFRGDLEDFDIGGGDNNDHAIFEQGYKINGLDSLTSETITARFKNEFDEHVATATINLEMMYLTLPGNQPESVDIGKIPLRSAADYGAEDDYLPPPSQEPLVESTVQPIAARIQNFSRKNYIAVHSSNDSVPTLGDENSLSNFLIEPATVPGKTGQFFTIGRLDKPGIYLGATHHGIAYYRLSGTNNNSSTSEVASKDELTIIWKFHESGESSRIESANRPNNYLHAEQGVIAAGPIQATWYSAWWNVLPSATGTSALARIQNASHKNYIAVHSSNDSVPTLGDENSLRNFVIEPTTVPGKTGQFFTIGRLDKPGIYLGATHHGIAYYRLSGTNNNSSTSEVASKDELTIIWQFHKSGESSRIESANRPNNYLHAEQGVIAAGPIQATWRSAWWNVLP